MNITNTVITLFHGFVWVPSYPSCARAGYISCATGNAAAADSFTKVWLGGLTKRDITWEVVHPV